MIRNQLRWAATLGLLCGVSVSGGCAAPHKMAVSSASPSSAANPDPLFSRPNATVEREPEPVAVLHRPVPLADQTASLPPPPAVPVPVEPVPVTPVGYQQPDSLVRAQAPDGVYHSMYQTPPPPPPPPTVTPPAPPFSAPEGGYIPNAPYDRPLTKPNGFWEHCHEWFGGSGAQPGGWFQSDCNFVGIISPVSNPFFNEDPRALTEVRPLFLFTTSSNKSPGFAGGDSFFYGLQGRLAFNDRWSVVLNKFGVVTFSPKDPFDDLQSGTGFAELNIGPKFTFIHNTASGTVGAVGLNFDFPVGDRKVLQDTGSLSLDPYFSIGQTFGRSSYGQFNFVGTIGYDVSVDDKRSDFFHTGLHLDYNIASANRWYPLMELNWFHYTTSGKSRDLGGLQGLDLGNFGSSGVADRNFVDLALGFRYKWNEHLQFGLAFEFPLSQSRDIEDFRLTLDMILRY